MKIILKIIDSETLGIFDDENEILLVKPGSNSRELIEFIIKNKIDSIKIVNLHDDAEFNSKSFSTKLANSIVNGFDDAKRNANFN